MPCIDGMFSRGSRRQPPQFHERLQFSRSHLNLPKFAIYVLLSGALMPWYPWSPFGSLIGEAPHLAELVRVSVRLLPCQRGQQIWGGWVLGYCAIFLFWLFAFNCSLRCPPNLLSPHHLPDARRVSGLGCCGGECTGKPEGRRVEWGLRRPLAFAPLISL